MSVRIGRDWVRHHVQVPFMNRSSLLPQEKLISRDGDCTATRPGADRRTLQVKVQIQSWREHRKDTLIGFFNIELSGQELVIKGLALHQKVEEFFISWPRSLNKAPDGRLPSVIGFSSDRFRKLWESNIIAELKKDGYISVPDSD